MAGGLTSGKMVDSRMVEGKGRPIWTVDDRESRVTPLDLQVSFIEVDYIIYLSLYRILACIECRLLNKWSIWSQIYVTMLLRLKSL